jgi:Na+/melibiose symporter-like transporter
LAIFTGNYAKEVLRLNLSHIEQKTFRLHMTYSVLEGIILGVLALNEFVFIKSIKGSSFQLGVLFQLSVIIFLLLLFINEFLRRIRDKKKLLRMTGLITRAPLLLLAFFPDELVNVPHPELFHYLFLGIFFIYYLSTPVVLPLINVFLKTNYTHRNFGRLYSYATAANKILLIITAFFYGLWLDHDHYAFRYVLPVTAILGFISIYFFSQISYSTESINGSKTSIRYSIMESIQTMLRILKENKAFRNFEWSFMIYGIGFMISIAIVVLYFEKALQLNYSSFAFYKNGYILLSILLLPFFGRLIGEIDPRIFGIYTLVALLLSILFITLTEFFPSGFSFWEYRIYYMLIFYVIFFGFFDAMMALLWYIGSSYFCRLEETGDYQAIHLFLTGVRGLFAPLLGILFYEWIGFTATFIIAMLTLLIGMYILYRSYKKDEVIRFG